MLAQLDYCCSVVQWGAVERQPGQYDWSGYQELFTMVKAKGLRVQAVMSFHACGGNVGDYAQVPLPDWVLKVSVKAFAPLTEHQTCHLSCLCASTCFLVCFSKPLA